jgi:hypothetical protein
MEFNDIFIENELRNLPVYDWRHWMFIESSKAGDIRSYVSRLLNFGENQKILNAEMLARLKNEDNDQFTSVINELAIGEFLSSISEPEWHPHGRDSRIGEFRITPRGYESIFVEVKTIFLSQEERKQQKNYEILREVAHGVFSPFMISINFTKIECDIVPRHFRIWLTRQVTTLKKVLLKKEEQKTSIFEEKMGNDNVTDVKVVFTKLHDSDLPTICGYSYVSWSNLDERVIEVIDGALSQLPENQANLVIIATIELVDLDEFTMMAAMFSRPKVTYKIYKEPTIIEEQELDIHYDLQGIVKKDIRKRLSAVGLWHHKWINEPSGSLDIYHNPFAVKQIPYQVLESPNIYQLIPKGVGSMEWVPNRPDKSR